MGKGIDFSKIREKIDVEADAIKAIAKVLGFEPSQEQIAICKNANKSLAVIAKPGTGKTATLKLAVLFNVVYRKIPLSKIKLISFTKATVREMSRTLKDDASKIGIGRKFNVSTLHSTLLKLINDISGQDFIIKTDLQKSDYLLQQRKRIGYYLAERCPALKGQEEATILLSRITENIKSRGTFSNESINTLPYYVKFQENFGDYGLDENDIRKMFWSGVDRLAKGGVINRGDIPIIAYYLINIDLPQVQGVVSNHKKDLVFVDEFQDLSIMELQLVSLLYKEVIAIGDPDQSIYGFKGSDAFVFERFNELYPSAVELTLSKSFRCPNASAKKTFEIIKSNYKKKDKPQPYKGVVRKYKHRYIEAKDFMNKEMDNFLVKLKLDTQAYNSNKPCDRTIIGFRTNVDVLNMMFNLVKKDVPFNLSKAYKGLHEIKGLNTYIDILKLLWEPNSRRAMYNIARSTSYEYSRKSPQGIPILLAYAKGLTYADIKSEEKYICDLAYLRKQLVKKGFSKDTPIINYLNDVYAYFNANLLKCKKAEFEDSEIDYHRLTLENLVKNDTYDELMLRDAQVISYLAKDYETPILISTFHSMKGLECDNVILFGVSLDTIPNTKRLHRRLGYDTQGAILDLVQERNLLYVATTRMRKSCTIIYNDTPSELLSDTPLNSDIVKIDNCIQNNSYTISDDTGTLMKSYTEFRSK